MGKETEWKRKGKMSYYHPLGTCVVGRVSPGPPPVMVLAGSLCYN